MCIILTCERGVRPSDELISDCFALNPDGAGLMWTDGGSVQISKGFMVCADLIAAIDSVPCDSPLVVHMRIATSGGIDTGTCHPFPICDSLAAMHAANVECRAAVAHNGVIRGMATDDKRGISDTIAFTAGKLNGLWRADNVVSRRMRRRIMDAAPSNRFAIMTDDGTVYRIGHGWNTVTYGIQASNDTWRWTAPRSTYYDTGRWFPDDWFDDEYADLIGFYCGDCDARGYCARHGAMCDGIDEVIGSEWYYGRVAV